MTGDFDELVDTEGLSAAERERLRHVHDLLVAAGPPPELSASLEHPPPHPDGATVLAFPLARRRRAAAAGLIAAVVAAAAFAGGYLLGDRGGGVEAVRVVQLQGVAQAASASVRVGDAHGGGNWPMELTVSGLPRQSADRAYYELFVWRHGKPGYPCVGFKMHDGSTTVRFTVPYRFKSSTKLVVTAIEPGKAKWPGKVVMRTA